ncbi:non-canonical poly(A) RNA polymerase PAPD5/7 [Pancytospora philotis]|nr:non-canonical poly(A) RNA polymerase PAPD5/7 [Pancytospora philotis]
MGSKRKEAGTKRYRSAPVSHLLEPTEVAGDVPLHRLNEEILRLYDKIRLCDAEVAVRDHVVQRYRRLIENGLEGSTKTSVKDNTKTSMECKVEPFGSSRTRILVHSSDIDLTVLVPTAARGGSAVYDDDRIFSNAKLSAIRTLIMKEGCSRNGVLHIRKARTPILKLVDKEFGLNVDISINKVDGIDTAEYIKKKLVERPSLRVFAVLLKYFLKSRGLSDAASGGLCSYAQFLMIMNFMGMHPLVQNGNIDVERNIAVLFMDFFLYFGVDFPYERSAIAVEGAPYRLNRDSGFYIDDPVSAGNNVASGCLCLKSIRDIFQYSYKVMAAALSSCQDAKKGFVHLWFRLDQAELPQRDKMLRVYQKKAGS